MPSFYDPDDIKVSPDRFRIVGVDAPPVIAMADSIKEVGQLQAVLITNHQDKELTDGLNRLMACKRLGRKVWCITEDEGQLLLNNPALRRAAEVQANVVRSDFTAAEHSRAIAEVHKLMTEVYGERRAGHGISEGWTQEDTAKKLGYKSHRTVSEAITITKALDSGAVPGLENATTVQEASKMVKTVVRLEAAKLLAQRQSADAPAGSEIQDPIQHFGEKLLLGNCLDGMRKLPAGLCNLFITDPPWAIDMDEAVEDRGSAGMKAVGSYADGKDILPLLKEVISEMYRVGKPDCYAVMFCGVRHWLDIAQTFKDAGFSVYSKMLIWVKIRSYESMSLNISRSHAPAIWPNSAYDAMVLARKGQPLLAQLGKPDVFVHPPVQGGERIHQAQKPLSLMEDIISRFYHPGTNPVLIDPFAGSASTLVAARRLGIKQYFGYELSKENRERAIAYMVNCYMKDLEAPTPLSETTLDLEDF